MHPPRDVLPDGRHLAFSFLMDRRLVVIGGSAGGIHALKAIVSKLPRGFPAPVLAVIHTSPTGPSYLPHVLSHAGVLPASHPRDGEALRPGAIFVAPPDHHLMLRDGRVRVVRGPQENRNRPAIDPLFRSAAKSHGPGVVAIVVSGLLDDGTAGLVAVKVGGGTTIVQDPADALHYSMPANALKFVEVDYVLPAAEIGKRLSEIVGKPAPKRRRERGANQGPLDA